MLKVCSSTSINTSKLWHHSRSSICRRLRIRYFTHMSCWLLGVTLVLRCSIDWVVSIKSTWETFSMTGWSLERGIQQLAVDSEGQHLVCEDVCMKIDSDWILSRMPPSVFVVFMNFVCCMLK